MTDAELRHIVHVLATPLGNHPMDKWPPDVTRERQKIIDRYHELKGAVGFRKAYVVARVEWLAGVLGKRKWWAA